jgi:C1A family cysteine protease
LAFSAYNKTLYWDPPTESSPGTYDISAHAMLLVGFQDDTSLDEGGYWIVKNSWGNYGGNGGYGYMLYGDVSSVYAVDGDAYFVPEPASMLLLGCGALGLLRRRR